MKISVVQQNYIIGDIKGNTQKIIKSIQEEKAKGADFIVFTELSVCGYPPRDFLYFRDFILQCNDAVSEICMHTDGVAVVVGAPTFNAHIDGKDLYNSAVFMANKNVEKIIHKTLLPTYDVFDEYRYFEPADKWEIVEYKGIKLAITICEDIWNLGDNPLYKICPMDKLMPFSPDLMVNLSASPFDYTHAEDRKAILSANVSKYNLPIVYCNSVGSQTEIVFDGGSLVMDKNGNIIGEMPYFQESSQIFTFENLSFQDPILVAKENVPQQMLDPEHLDFDLNIDRIYDALVMGIKDYFQKMGFKKAVLGASGGVDSALTQALAVAALGKENVVAALMPSQFSTSHSIDDALALCHNLGNQHHIIEIKNIYDVFEQSLEPIFTDKPFDVTEENIQSRSRGVLVMALANKFGYILLNTSNKSELATGYGTLYGDMAGGLGVLGDVYKMQIYALCRYINRNGEIIPQNILDKAPSAELRPGQKDSDSLPEYNILDTILYQYIERSLSPEVIVNQGFDYDLVLRILKMVNKNEYKRAQFCPIIRVSPKSFGVGRRIPIVARYLT